MRKRQVNLVLGILLLTVVVATAGFIAPRSAGQGPQPDARIGRLQADLELAKQFAREEKFDEAIQKAEAAIAKMRELRDEAKGQPDLIIVALTGDGNRVTATVRNQGTADIILTRRVGPAQQLQKTFAGFNVKIINANTNKPFDPNHALENNYVGGIAPGETKQVSIGPITGCGGQPAQITAIVSTRATESNTANNESEVVRITGGPCSH